MNAVPAAAPLVSAVIPSYNDAHRAIALAQALATQRLRAGASLETIIVDDGSEERQAAALASTPADIATVVSLGSNRGRAIARNRGAEHASGQWLLFIDSDCLPANDQLVDMHLDATRGQATVASTGPVVGSGAGFWHRYQSDASRRREAQHRRGVACSGSSQNMFVLREAFRTAGGFSDAYRSYGFEDRDLLVRLSALGLIAWAADAVVRHMDPLSLRSVATKMQAAAGAAAQEFSRAHPCEYRSLGYARIDARLHAGLRLPARALSRTLPAMVALGEHLTGSALVPYPVARACAKIVSAAAYLAGTVALESGR